MTGRFIQFYRENAKYLERTFAFVERIGIDRLRQLLVDDSDGICAQLDADMQAATDAYVDKEERGKEKASDHAPVVVELDI